MDLGQNLGERQLDIGSIQSRRFHKHQVVLLSKGLFTLFDGGGGGGGETSMRIVS